MKQGWMGLIVAISMCSLAFAATPAETTKGPSSVHAKVKQVGAMGRERSGECWTQGNKIRVAWKMGRKTSIYLYQGRKVLRFDSKEKKVREMRGSRETLIPWLSIYKPAFGDKRVVGNGMVDGKACTIVTFLNDRSQMVKEWSWKKYPSIVLKQEITFDGDLENGTYISGMSVNTPFDDALFELPPDWKHYLVGEKAPAFALQPYNSKTRVRLSSFRGKKPVLLNFFATWCIPCKRELPDFIEVYQEYKDKVQFLSIDVFEYKKDGDPKALVAKFVKEFGVPWPVLMDDKDYGGKPKVSNRSYDAMKIPVNVGVDKQGIIRFHRRGATNAAQLREELNKLFPSPTAP